MARAPSFGATVGYDTAGGTSYTTLGHVKDITGPNISRGTIDITDHDSPDGFREFFGGLVDGGEITFAIGLDHTDTAHSGLFASFTSTTETPWAWLFTFNVASGTYTWALDGFLTALSPSAALEGQNTWELTIKVTGKPVLTASA